MKITCESCGAKYTIADDKVRGRKVKIRCKGCGTPIVVDGQQPAPLAEESERAEAEAPLSTEAPVSTPAEEGEWSVNLSETEQASLNTQQVVEGWQAGRITADAFVWKDGMADWLPILECPELALLLTSDPAAATPAGTDAPLIGSGSAPEAAMPAALGATAGATRGGAASARIAGGRAQGAPDLFAGVAVAGADEEDVATSAPSLPHLGGGRAQEEKPTGARNENSVLFSLDALKAGFAGPAPAAEPQKQGSRAAPSADDPFGMGAAPSVAGIGMGSPLFSLADNQALLTAPPPPEPPRRVVEATFGSGGAPAESPQKSLVLLGVLGVGILGVGLALGLGLSGGEKSESTGPSPSAVAEGRGDEKDDETPSGAEAKEGDSETAKPEKAEEPKADEPATEQAALDAGTSDGSGGAAQPDERVASTLRATAKPAAKTAAKEPAPAAAAGAQPFSRGAAVSALGSAASQAASCKKIGGPTGSGKVTVTFAPSGRVTTATVNGAPFAGTPVGGCVASVFRRAKVPSFSGSAVTVSKSFTIR